MDHVDQTEVGGCGGGQSGQAGSWDEARGADWKPVRWLEGRQHEVGGSEPAGSAAEGCGLVGVWKAQPAIGAEARSSPSEWRSWEVAAPGATAPGVPGLAESGHGTDSCLVERGDLGTWFLQPLAPP